MLDIVKTTEAVQPLCAKIDLVRHLRQDRDDVACNYSEMCTRCKMNCLSSCIYHFVEVLIHLVTHEVLNVCSWKY